jgi:hypothetical protein
MDMDRRRNYGVGRLGNSRDLKILERQASLYRVVTALVMLAGQHSY